MTYSDIKTQIAEGSFDNFYIFTGEELEVQRRYINKIAESKHQTIRRIDSVAEAFRFKGLSLLDQSVCYVCREDSEFQKAESTWDSVPEKVGKNTLIYLAAKLDHRSKFYMNWESRILEFSWMTEQVLVKHIRRECPLSTENCKELIRICEGNFGRILSELDKVKCYLACESELTEDRAFQRLLADGTIYQPPTDAIFDWVNAVLAGKPRRAFALYQECLAIGEPALRLLLVLYQGVKRLLQVQSCQAQNISENTGLSQWEVNLVKDFTGIYRTTELVDALRNIRALEIGIKTGQAEEELAVPYAMVSLLGTW